MKKLFFVSLLVLSFCFVQANDLDDLLGDFGSNESGIFEEEKNEVAIQDFELEFLGEHANYWLVPVDPDEMNWNSVAKTPRFANKMGVQLNYKNLKLVSMWNLDLHLASDGDINKIFQAGYDENALYWSPWKFNIGLGFQYYSWGKADGLNPTDNLTPRDYRFGFDADKLPLFSASINFYPTNWFSLETVYVPYYQRSVYPKDFLGELEKIDGFARKSPKTELSNSDLLGRITNLSAEDGEKALTGMYLSKIDASQNKNVKYKFRDFDFMSPIVGGRVNFTTTVVDFSFSYLYDFDKFPSPVIKLVKQDFAQLLILKNPADFIALGPAIDAFQYQVCGVRSIELEYRRIHRIGADIKSVFENGMGLWLEANYSMTDDYMNSNYKIRNDQLAWTLGTDFSYGPGKAFYTNIQYTGLWNINYDDAFYKDYKDGKPDEKKLGNTKYMEEFYYRAISNQLASVYAGLVQGLTFNMKFPLFDDFFTPELSAGYMLPLLYDYNHETKYGALVVKPSLSFMPFDSFFISLGADLAYAWHKKNGKVQLDRETDQLGPFIQDNRIYLEFKYQWSYELRK